MIYPLIAWWFSIVMLVYQRVNLVNLQPDGPQSHTSWWTMGSSKIQSLHRVPLGPSGLGSCCRSLMGPRKIPAEFLGVDQKGMAIEGAMFQGKMMGKWWIIPDQPWFFGGGSRFSDQPKSWVCWKLVASKTIGKESAKRHRTGAWWGVSKPNPPTRSRSSFSKNTHWLISVKIDTSVIQIETDYRDQWDQSYPLVN